MTTAQIEEARLAIAEWLEFGEHSLAPPKEDRMRGHQGYFSRGGWAYEALLRLDKALADTSAEGV